MTSDSASRVTRSSRDLRLAVVLFLGGLAGVTALRAQEPVRTPSPAASPAASAPSREPAAETPAPAPAASEAKSQPADDKTAPAGAAERKPGTTGSSSTHFEPTEKVRADFDVSFPVDI
jgi:cytoskeletal protein RodZ